MKVKKKISDILLNIVICILTLSMLTMTVLYAKQKATQNNSDTQTFDNLWIVNDFEESAFSLFDISYSVPTLIAYKETGKAAGATVFDSGLTSALYSALSDSIVDIFGQNSVCISENVQYADAVNELLSADSYILFEYSCALPFPYLYALCSAQSNVDISMCAGGEVADISRLALILSQGENGETYYTCYGFDFKNNACRFEHVDNSPYILQASDKIYIDAYSESFERIDLVKTGDDEPSVQMLYGSFGYSLLDETSDISMLRLGDEQSTTAFLKHFEINPEKANRYTDADGTTVFISTDERLAVTSGKIIEYTCEKGGIPIKKVLGYTPGKKSSFSLFDMLKATNIFISEIRLPYPQLMGKSADIKLSAIYKTQAEGDAQASKAVFEYSYFYNGVKIDTAPAFYFEFSANTIQKIQINISGFSTSSEKNVLLPKATAYNRISQELGTFKRISPLYSPDDTQLYNIKWAVWQ